MVDPKLAGAVPRRDLVPIGRNEALILLGSVDLGRIVFTQDALPTIRPVNHAVFYDHLVICTDQHTALARAIGPTGTVMAYEADMVDPITHLGWSVVVVGIAHHLTDQDQLTPYQSLVVPWFGRDTQPVVVLMTLDRVDGFRAI